MTDFEKENWEKEFYDTYEYLFGIENATAWSNLIDDVRTQIAKAKQEGYDQGYGEGCIKGYVTPKEARQQERQSIIDWAEGQKKTGYVHIEGEGLDAEKTMILVSAWNSALDSLIKYLKENDRL